MEGKHIKIVLVFIVTIFILLTVAHLFTGVPLDNSELTAYLETAVSEATFADLVIILILHAFISRK